MLLERLERSPCVGVPVDVFFPPIRDRGCYDAAAEVCARCPVIDACFEYLRAVEASGPMGAVWGYAAGLTPVERKILYRAA